jgi:hypothetical protein
LVSLFDFENRDGIFPNVHRSCKFCLFTTGSGLRPSTSVAEFVFFALGVEDLKDSTKRFTLSADDIALLNPNSHNCPGFRCTRDAELTKLIYRNVAVLLNESKGDVGNPWGIEIGRMFHTSDDSPLFCAEENENTMRLYEAKCFWQFDHRHATFAAGDYRDVEEAEKADSSFRIKLRYNIERNKIPGKFVRRLAPWFLSFRKITRATDARTLIVSITPESGLLDSGNNIYITSARQAACLIGACNSLAVDFAARQKIGGPNMTVGILSQLPILPPAAYAQPCLWASEAATLQTWLLPRVLELTYTAWDLEPFARDCGYDGPPFRWDEARRFLLRCELDAAFFHLYGINRDDAAYIMDTFPIVKRKDIAAHGTYRTQETILRIYDALAAAQRTGQPYQTVLNPPPADPRCCHPAKEAK